jgi:phosphoribosyl 1,2-cyclic phosphodiesterase
MPLLTNKVTPYIANGFLIQGSLIYISDVSFIPEETWALLEESRERNGQLSVAVIDCLRPEKHTSHFGLKEAVSTARRIGAMRSYCVGFGHEVPHAAYEKIFGAVDGQDDRDGLTTTEQHGIGMIELGDPIWIRPAYDGLQVTVSEGGIVNDNGY